LATVLQGTLDLNTITEIGGYFFLLEPANRPRRFHIKVSPEPPPRGRVQHRRLTKIADSGNDSDSAVEQPGSSEGS